MSLNNTSPYPHARRYLIKVSSDAQPCKSSLRGQLENLKSGNVRAFACAQELVTQLLLDLDEQSQQVTGHTPVTQEPQK